MPTDTFNIAASGDDGYAAGTGSASYPPASGTESNTSDNAVAAWKRFDGSFYNVYAGLIRWDTSSIPNDAVIESVTLRIHVVSKANDDTRSFALEWYDSGTIGTEDYTSTVGTNAHAGTAIASITSGADNDFALINVSNVNKTGYTGLRCHVSGGTPTGSNLVEFAALDHTTLVEPRLIVTYIVPTATFNIASSNDDADTRLDEENYLPSGTPTGDSVGNSISVSKWLSGGVYRVREGLLRWDTSSIPDDATIDAVTLRLRFEQDKFNVDSRSLTAEWYEFGTLDEGDWSGTVGTNAHAGTALSAITDNADNDLVLINVSNVSLTGYTGLRLHISGGQPTGFNTVNFAAFDHATLTEPRLLVWYTVEGDPTSVPSLFIARSNARW